MGNNSKNNDEYMSMPWFDSYGIEFKQMRNRTQNKTIQAPSDPDDWNHATRYVFTPSSGPLS